MCYVMSLQTEMSNNGRKKNTRKVCAYHDKTEKDYLYYRRLALISSTICQVNISVFLVSAVTADGLAR